MRQASGCVDLSADSCFDGDMQHNRPANPPSRSRSNSPLAWPSEPPPSAQGKASQAWLSPTLSKGIRDLTRSSPVARPCQKQSTLPSRSTKKRNRKRKRRGRLPAEPNNLSPPSITYISSSSGPPSPDETQDEDTSWEEGDQDSRWEEQSEADFTTWHDKGPRDKPFTSKWQPLEVPAPAAEPIHLNKEQSDLLNLIKRRRNVFYTGSGGSGKSTVLKAAVSQLQQENDDISIRILAPTGCAAVNVEGVTTWAFMGWNPDSLRKGRTDLINHSWRKQIMKRLREVHVLIIDEISMVENHFFERMNFCMKAVRQNDKPFGGCQIVVTGDFFQLPPVKPFERCMECGEPTEHIKGEQTCVTCKTSYGDRDKWAFRSKTWDECNFDHVALHQIHRQADHTFIRPLQKVRRGEPLATDEIDHLMQHRQVDDATCTHLYPTNRQAEKVNDSKFGALPGPSYAYQSLDSLELRETAQDTVEKKFVHVDHELWRERTRDGMLRRLDGHKMDTKIELKKGMIVLLRVNLDLPRGLSNGSQGRIIDFEDYDPTKLPPKGSDERGEYRAEQVQLFVQKYADSHQQQKPVWPIVLFHNGVTQTIHAECITSTICSTGGTPTCFASRTQIPLIPGWAISIHKSQGMTLPQVRVNLARCFASGQAYVALSRATCLEGLKIEGGLGSRQKLEEGKGCDGQVLEFYKEKGLLHPEPADAIPLDEGLSDDWLLDNFTAEELNGLIC